MADTCMGWVHPTTTKQSWGSGQVYRMLGRHQQPAEGFEGDYSLGILATYCELMPSFAPPTISPRSLPRPGQTLPFLHPFYPQSSHG